MSKPTTSQSASYPPRDSNIAKLFRQDDKTKARELVLTTRLTHDLLTAAAARGYDLLVYTTTVDSDGFDLIVDDRDSLLPLQFKSVLKGSTTSGWNIHRKMLRPQYWQLGGLGLEFSPLSDGRNGGVVLIDVAPLDAALEITYSFTSFYVLLAFWHGALEIRGRGKGATALTNLQRELFKEPAGEICVPRSAFLTAKSPEHLLALMGLHSRYNHTWTTNVIQLARRDESAAPLEHLREYVGTQLEELSVFPTTLKAYKHSAKV